MTAQRRAILRRGTTFYFYYLYSVGGVGFYLLTNAY